MYKLLLATIIVAVAVGSSLLSTANAGGGYSTYRDRLGFGNPNGTQLTGLLFGDAIAIDAVILPSGEIAGIEPTRGLDAPGAKRGTSK